MLPHPLCNPREHLLSRRQLLGVAGASALSTANLHCPGTGLFDGLTSPVVADDLRRRDKQVLLIWLDGGMSQLESWDPKPNTEFGGPYRDIATTVPGIRVSELLRRTAKQMHHLAIVRSVSTQDNSHSAGVARIQRGDPKNRGVDYPFLGSAISKLLGPGSTGLPPYLSVKPGNGGFIPAEAGFLGAKYGALAFGDGKPPENLLLPSSLTAQDDDLRNELRAKLNARYAERHQPKNVEANSYVYDMARELSRLQNLFDDSQISASEKARYGDHDFGRHLHLGRRLLEAGARFVKVTSLGWDSHGDNFNACRSLIGKFDQSFAALIEDLADRRMLEQTLVIVMSEFGRTPKINSHVGRDHWPECWSIAMAGCGLNRGVAVGSTNQRGDTVATDPYDIGHFFHTWFNALGIDPTKIAYDNHGQPLPLAREDFASIPGLLA